MPESPPEVDNQAGPQGCVPSLQARQRKAAQADFFAKSATEEKVDENA